MSEVKADDTGGDGNNPDNVRTCRTVIIGAGMAGLSAANHLLKNNINDFVIIEGRNRVGGRIIAITIDGRRMELGANWIHGILGNPIYELASSHGLVNIIQENKPHNVVATLPDGKRVPFHILQEIYDAYFWFFKRCEEYFLCKYLPPDGVKSVGAHLKLEMSIYLEQFSGHERHIRNLIFNYLLNRETCISGCDSMEEIDLMEIGSYTELPGGNIILPGGYSSILGPLTKDIPDEKFLKGHPVTSIRWRAGLEGFNTTDSGLGEDITNKTLLNSDIHLPGCRSGHASVATSPSKKVRPKVEVICKNGKKFYAEHVICTIPLGVLKESGKTLFDPPLPDYKVDSINRLCFGVVDKIYLEYERPFLNPGLSEVLCLWDPIDLKEPVSERWFKKIYSFTKVSETLLLAWISGEEAKYMETLAFDVVSEKCTEILRQFLNDPFIPKPKRCINTTWWSQPFTRGSYSALGIGASQVDITNISHPLYMQPTCSKPAVLFAGEHCHPSFYSTVHGAYLSGRDAAQVLCMPDTPPEVVLDVEGTADLSSWLEGISLT
ncbi:peroxisomal N(1)-acetyl-spermine/spermidine oxidase-like [Homarus americanus]|uniref:Peroxisomal N(1)-acetyl-spermine/spermidine oxidase-like 1 n=1 Tax=Homarus americanus TaxID=6706 RepID=A0A8J5MVP0_HOMAM|nr:peroxisomal N(1)-acetyl-spermine/spermidine oxidase-like [Homarus americanus]KAG7165112.1 Peroxisomal N(1)-acetyl-spermine/spermidine oxidase-like 1 [Homarus americanus]